MRVHASERFTPLVPDSRTAQRHPEIETALQIQFRSVEKLLQAMDAVSGRGVPRRLRRR